MCRNSYFDGIRLKITCIIQTSAMQLSLNWTGKGVETEGRLGGRNVLLV